MVGDNKMNSKEILEKIKILSNEEKRKINYENLKEIMEYMKSSVHEKDKLKALLL